MATPTKTMKGEWCEKTWSSSPLGTLVRFEGENYYKMLNGHVAMITQGNTGVADIYHDWDNADYNTHIFYTVKTVPDAVGFMGDSNDLNWTPMKRADKRGHSKPTSLKDMIAYLNGSFVGETVVEHKGNKTFITLYKE